MPPNFLFSQTPSMTPTHDSISRLPSRLPLATKSTTMRPFRDYTCDSISRLHSRLLFATHIRDSTSDSRSRLTFATPDRDSRLRPQSRLTISVTSPSLDSTTDGWTVLTPLRHLPSVPTLTLIIFLEPSPWPGLYL